MIKVEAYKYEYKEDPPLIISFYRWDFRENVLVKLIFKNFEGLGEAAPMSLITGDSQEDVIMELSKIKEINLDPISSTPKELHELMDLSGIKSHTLRAAIDFAFHDLKAQILEIPVWKMFSNSIKNIPMTVTIFLKESLKETQDEAKKILEKYDHLKNIKIKLSGQEDFSRCKAIKETVKNRDVSYTLDANQAYKDPITGTKELNKIVELLDKVILIEQPCPKEDLKSLKFLKDNVRNTFIFADEAAATFRDVEKIIANQASHGINIKLQKAGGIYPSQKIAELANKNGLKIMIGEMMEGPIGTAAGISCANNLPGIILTDLDMDLSMEEHFKGEIPFINGCRMPSNEKGFGLSLNNEKIKELQNRQILKFERIKL